MPVVEVHQIFISMKGNDYWHDKFYKLYPLRMFDIIHNAAVNIFVHKS